MVIKILKFSYAYLFLLHFMLTMVQVGTKKTYYKFYRLSIQKIVNNQGIIIVENGYHDFLEMFAIF